MSNLPETGFLRLPQIIGQEAVTEEQARENRKRGNGPKRKRPGIPALVPVKKSTWWQWIRDGRAPQPIKLGPRVTVWDAASIREFLENGPANGGQKKSAA